MTIEGNVTQAQFSAMGHRTKFISSLPQSSSSDIAFNDMEVEGKPIQARRETNAEIIGYPLLNHH